MKTGPARRAIIAFAMIIALPVCAAQAQPRGWGGGWAGPFVGGAILGLGLGLLPYAVPPPAYYYPPAYYRPPPYPYAYGYYGNPYAPGYYGNPYTPGYYGNPYTPGYYGYASPPAPYPGQQAYVQPTNPAALDPNNCGTPDAPKPCSRR